MGTHTAIRTTAENERNSQIAGVIRSQIGAGVLMSLGATDLAYDGPALTFRARILNKRHVKRIMRVTVRLEPSDTYSIRVGYASRADWIQHYSADGIYCDSLARVLLALDDVI